MFESRVTVILDWGGFPVFGVDLSGVDVSGVELLGVVKSADGVIMAKS